MKSRRRTHLLRPNSGLRVAVVSANPSFRPASHIPPAGQNEIQSHIYSLIATPLNPATPTELDVATGVRSP